MAGSNKQELLAEFSRGGKLIFENAEELYREACLLRKNGALSRALCLHQLSNEECGKLSMLGAYTISVTVGREVDLKDMEKAFRNHEAKNRANSYFADLTNEEREARARGDWPGSSKAFENLQAKLHEIFNTNKNAALYVNFQDGTFSAPKEVVAEDLVAEMAALNEYFLGITQPYVRLLRRVEKNEWGFQDSAIAFMRRIEEIGRQIPDDPVAVFNEAFEEMLRNAKPTATRK